MMKGYSNVRTKNLTTRVNRKVSRTIQVLDLFRDKNNLSYEKEVMYVKVNKGLVITILLSIGSGLFSSLATYFEARDAAKECKEDFNEVMNELLEEDRTKAS